LRLQIVQFFRECDEGLHGILGERVMTEVHEAMQVRVVSSCAQTRCNNKKPRSVKDYFAAVSLQSVWVEGRCTPYSVPVALICRIAQLCSHFSGYHWIRAVAHLFDVHVIVYIYRWQHCYIFGDPANGSPAISLWKSDVETHFEPLIPISCKCTLPAHSSILNLTSLAVVEQDTSELELHLLERQPQWSAVYSEFFPPSPPESRQSSVHSSPQHVQNSDFSAVMPESHFDDTLLTELAAAAASAEAAPGKSALLGWIAVYTASYTCSASHCQNAVRSNSCSSDIVCPW
jgi:hypothetical protein